MASDPSDPSWALRGVSNCLGLAARQLGGLGAGAQAVLALPGASPGGTHDTVQGAPSRQLAHGDADPHSGGRSAGRGAPPGSGKRGRHSPGRPLWAACGP